MAPACCSAHGACCLCEARASLDAGMRPRSKLCPTCFRVMIDELRRCAAFESAPRAICCKSPGVDISTTCQRWESAEAEIDYSALVLGSGIRRTSSDMTHLAAPSRGSSFMGSSISPTSTISRISESSESVPFSMLQLNTSSSPSSDPNSTTQAGLADSPNSGKLLPPPIRTTVRSKYPRKEPRVLAERVLQLVLSNSLSGTSTAGGLCGGKIVLVTRVLQG